MNCQPKKYIQKKDPQAVGILIESSKTIKKVFF